MSCFMNLPPSLWWFQWKAEAEQISSVMQANDIEGIWDISISGYFGQRSGITPNLPADGIK